MFRATGWTVGALILAGADPAEPHRWDRQLGLVALDPGGSVVFGRPIMVAGRLPDERRTRTMKSPSTLRTRRPCSRRARR